MDIQNKYKANTLKNNYVFSFALSVMIKRRWLFDYQALLFCHKGAKA